MSRFSGQKVNGLGSGSAYQSALHSEVLRRIPEGPRLKAALDQLATDRYYSEDEYDYFITPALYLDNRLNRKAIIHRLELWGFTDVESIYDDERFAEVKKGYPLPENPQDGDGWVAVLLADATQGAKCPWQLLDGWNWAELLAQCPQFAEFCAWEKLDSCAWAYLLAATPAFDAKCDFKIFDGVEWLYLVKRRPELAVRLDKSILNDRDRARIEKVLQSAEGAETVSIHEREGSTDTILLADRRGHAQRLLHSAGRVPGRVFQKRPKLRHCEDWRRGGDSRRHTRRHPRVPRFSASRTRFS